MSRRTTAELLPAEDIIEVDIGKAGTNTAADEAADEWSDFLSSATDGAKVHIYKQMGDGRMPMAFVDAFDVDEFDPAGLMKRLQREYGGGNYRVQVRQGGRVRANKLLSVAESLTSKELALSPGAKNNDRLSMAMLDKLDKLTERLSERADPMEDFKKTLALVTMMKEAFGMNGATAAPPSPLSQLKEMMQTMTMMQEMKTMLSGDAPEKEEGFFSGKLLDVLGKVAPAAFNAMAASSMQQPRQPVRPQPQPAPRVVNPNEEANTVPKQDAAQMDAYRKQLEQLCNACDFGLSTESIADTIVKKLTDEQAAQMAHQLEGGQFLDDLIAIHPPIADRREWFEDLQEWLKGQFGLASIYADRFADPVDNSENPDDDGTEIADDDPDGHVP